MIICEKRSGFFSSTPTLKGNSFWFRNRRIIILDLFTISSTSLVRLTTYTPSFVRFRDVLKESFLKALTNVKFLQYISKFFLESSKLPEEEVGSIRVGDNIDTKRLWSKLSFTSEKKIYLDGYKNPIIPSLSLGSFPPLPIPMELIKI